MCQDIIEIVVSVIVGLATGFITSAGITIYYRKKDKIRDVGNYITELLFRMYVIKNIIPSQGILSSDDEVKEYIDFFVNYKLLPRYKWIKFEKTEQEDIETVEKFILDLKFKAVYALTYRSSINRENIEKEIIDIDTIKLNEIKQELMIKSIEAESLYFKLLNIQQKYVNQVELEK